MAVTSLNAYFLALTIRDVAEPLGFNYPFVGMILLPIATHGAEHLLTIKAALKNTQYLVTGTLVARSIQLLLLVTPLVTIVGWIIKVPIALHAAGLESLLCFTLTFLLHTYILNGESTWFNGFMAMSAYVVSAVVIFYQP